MWPCGDPGRIASLAALTIVSVTTVSADSPEHYETQFVPKKKHTWSFAEFQAHKEQAHIPRHGEGIMPGTHNTAHRAAASNRGIPAHLLRHRPKEVPTEEHWKWGHQPDEVKVALYKEWIAEHTAIYEQEEWEKTTPYKLYYLLFHWQSGALGLTLVLVKVLIMTAGCWCLCRHKAKLTLDCNPNSPFTRRYTTTKGD